MAQETALERKKRQDRERQAQIRENKRAARAEEQAQAQESAIQEPFPDREVKSGPDIDPSFLIGHTLDFSHDALAAVTQEPAMRLSPLEKDVMTKSLTWSVELAGVQRYVVFLAPVLAIFVLFVVEWKRVLLLSDLRKQRAAEAQIAADAEDRHFAEHFEPEPDPVPVVASKPVSSPAGNGRSTTERIVPQHTGAGVIPRPISTEE